MVNYSIKLIKSYFSHYTGLNFTIWCGIILSFIESGFIGVYYFLPIYFTEELGFSITNAGIILSFFGFGTILGGFAGGKLADSFSANTVCTNSLFFQSMIFLMLINLQSIPLLSLDLFLMGFFSYAFITSNHLGVLAKCDNETSRLKSLNLLNIASNLALAFSGLIIGYFAIKHFLVVFKTGSFILFVLASLMLSLKNKINKQSTESQTNNKSIISNKSKNKSNLNKLIFFILLFSFMMGFIIFQTTTYSIYLKTAFPNLGIKSYSILLSINCLMVVFMQAPIVNILGKYNKILTMGCGGFLIGLGMVLLPFSYGFVIAVLGCVIYTTGEMIFCSISQLLCYELGNKGAKGKTMGMYRMIYASSRVAAPSLGGLIFEQISGDMLWYVCGLLGSITLAICSYYRNLSLD